MTAARGHRRGVIAGGLALGLLAAGARAAGTGDEDMALGAATAPVTVIEYASVGCPHCGVWAREVFPTFRQKYVDTGKVRFVFREMLYGNANLAAAGFLTARCAGRAKYFQVVDGIFTAQDQIGREGMPALLRVAKDAGLSQAQVTACLTDKTALAALQARTDRYAQRDKISGTPTFVVSGRKLVGDQSLAELDAAIAGAGRR